MKRIGIMGGTFNPIHNAHLLVANEVLNQLHLDKIIFMPTYQPPRIENKHTINAKDRFKMVQLAIKDNPNFSVSNLEIKRGNESYTYQTVKQLKLFYPHDKFFWIIGSDELDLLPKWSHISDLIKSITFVAVNRNQNSNQKWINKHPDYPIKTVNIPRFDISSTLIRNRIKHHQSVRYLIPNLVYSYIKRHHLYQN